MTRADPALCLYRRFSQRKRLQLQLRWNVENGYILIFRNPIIWDIEQKMFSDTDFHAISAPRRSESHLVTRYPILQIAQLRAHLLPEDIPGVFARPIAAAMGQELLKGDYIQADETPGHVQMHDGGGKNHQAYLWRYSRPGGPVVFDFRMGREREGPKRFLGNFEGILQSDGYGAYDHVGGAGIVHAACSAQS